MAKNESKQTLDEIEAQIAELRAKAEEIRKAEKAGALTQARELVHKYGLTAKELGLDASGAPVAIKAKRKAAEPKYANPADPSLIWSGRGRMPSWLADLVHAGNDIEKYRIAK